MDLNGLLAALIETPVFQQWTAQIHADQPLPDQDILRSARPYVVAALAIQLQRPIILLTARPDRAYNVTEQLPVWLPGIEISRFEAPTPDFYERAPWSENTIRARLQTLGLLANYHKGDPPLIVVASAQALMQKTLPLREFKRGSRKLSVGSQHDPNKLMRLWLELGYEAVSIVSQPGQFSHRGGIVDVFPPTHPKPLRLDFFDTDLESIRYFDPATQRSLEPVERITFYPTREALPKNAPQVAEKLAPWFLNQPDDDDAISVRPDFEGLQQGAAFPMLEYYLPWMYEEAASLLDYLPENALVLMDDWGAMRDAIEELEEQALQLREERIQKNQLPPDAPLAYHTWDALLESIESRHPIHLGRGDLHPNDEKLLGELFMPDQRFGGQIRTFLEHLQNLRKSGHLTITVTRQAEHVAQLWSEINPYIAPVSDLPTLDKLNPITFIEGELNEGWVLHTESRQIHLLTDSEIFGWKRPEPRRRQRPRTVTPESFFADLAVGDYVVHVEYGIARFAGLIKRTFDGNEREFLKLEYADNDTIFVPIHQAERITRYVGADDTAPKLNRVGTQEWIKTRKKASEAAEALAEELLHLYAERELSSGFAFAPDNPWQHELEASFPYVETEDQLKAISDVKRDMEMARSMDRLVCGDVGYGKTEVALRAAFKATMDGKQVAVLVPTTILAQQHYQTFVKRLVNFPVKVEMLSRFRSEDQQKAILKDTRNGAIDIVIGTHRLLQDDLHFKNLGLLIIDEEQRFGITHKEQLKKMRVGVDVLALTATPIPRTLYMSLTGIRDISVIQTAPEERLPVATHVGNFDERLIRQAILRELDRGGQVFFVHNRVQSISSIAELLRGLVPEANFAIAHGQLHERQLEKVMTEFSAGDYDVLISTSIIESGLDIPNANTIIIDRADWFGLADLYQLRGRVGRSAQQAYSYFFHPPTHRLTEEARARLDTISEETQLGAGLSIAMRDLEIRGAGDLLGKRQSGHIAAVGFHLYTQLLSQAVRKLKARKGITPSVPVSTSPLTIDLPIPAYIPAEYIPETALRIQLYRRLADLHTLASIDEIRAELTDRFGEIPRAVEGLLYQLRIKLLAGQAHATAIVQEQQKIGIKLPYLGQIDRAKLQNDLGYDVRVSRTAIWLPRDKEDITWQFALLEMLEKLAAETLPEIAG